MHPANPFLAALVALRRADVDLVVVGMVSAVLQGAPQLTFDLDIVHERSPENVARLLDVLTAIDAVYRHDPRKIRPRASLLAGTGHNLFSTQLRDLDCLGTIDDGLGYHELLPHSVELDLGDGLACRALGLEKLIEVKRRAGRPKDLAALPVLEATLDERRGGRS